MNFNPDIEFALYCYDLYNNATDKYFTKIGNVNDIVYGINYTNDSTVLTFRGSVTGTDWLRDFQFKLVDDTELGLVEEGFLEGLKDIYNRIIEDIPKDKPLIITGHSLGAARAFLFAALLLKRGYNKDLLKLIVFESPQPGVSTLGDIVQVINPRSYKVNDDIVCSTPFNTAVMKYVQPVKQTQLQLALPQFTNPHHIENVLAALLVN